MLLLALFCGMGTLQATDYANLSLDSFIQMTSSTTAPSGDHYYNAVVTTSITHGSDQYCYYYFENSDGSLSWSFTPRCTGYWSLSFSSGGGGGNASDALFTNTTIGETVVEPNLGGVSVTYSNIGWVIEFPVYVHCVGRQSNASYTTVYWGLTITPEESFDITAVCDPEEGGTVSGVGTHLVLESCTLTATPSEGYIFRNWTENGVVVSTDADYTFVVLGDRNLVANFVAYNGEGTIHGLFSVSNGNYVFFSQGNLQYIGSAETPYWKFAEHQWDYLGDNGQGSDSPNVDRDLFGWGTSGYNHGAVCYQPWSTSQTNSDYYAYGNENYSLFDQTGQADWGYNAISNGGNQEDCGWRTLTIEEWQYLFITRSTPSGIRYAKAKVNDVNGVILLPDDWNANYYTLNSTNSSGASYTTNTITATQWAILEQFGAVFFPAAGFRYGTSVNDAGSIGNYWSSSPYYSNSAWYVFFNDSGLSTGSYDYRYCGQSLRLVFPSQAYSFGINATPSPTEGGAVSGAGAYLSGAECTLTATPSEGYAFLKWTENGIVVSMDANYTFAVLRDRNLVANFIPIIPEGGKNGVFTVNADGISVVFSQGNLQYIGSAETPYWKFADHQWDYLGATTGQNSSDQNKDRDLFGWGTSGYSHGANCYQPWSINGTNNDYLAYGNSSNNLNDRTGQADWGYNAISNGGNQENSGWRTLTHEEWQYLFNTRSTPSGIRYAKAKVNNVNGVILLPDDWNANYYTLNSTNSTGASYTTNTIAETQWTTLEQFGAVFLPAAGYRSGATVFGGSYGYYWSSSFGTGSGARLVYFTDSQLGAGSNYNRYNGQSVRLVFPSQGYSFAIGATPRPMEGAVSGAGAYARGAECTLTATASAGYIFANWTENGVIVSTDATYTFAVWRERNLVANFVTEGNISFTDANVKALCVANWDTNGDGELSYAEAAKVTDLGSVFKNNADIHSFNELSYFIGLNFIGEQAFYGCTDLMQITIPELVKTVAGRAFWNCPVLQTVYFNAANCVSMQTCYNSNTYSVFSSDESGGTPAITRVVIGNGVQHIPDYAFKDAANIYPGLAIRSSVTTIGAHAFENCSSITTVTFQNTPTLTTIGDYAFSGCTAWNKPLSLPNSLNTIGAYSFNGCTGLTGNLVIPNTVTAIGEGAFSGCSGFNGTLTLPVNDLFTRINDNTFNGCSGFNGALTLPSDVTVIANGAFQGCSGFTGPLVFHDAVSTIGQYAFAGCSGFTGDLVIPNSVNTIGQYAFSGCSGFDGSLTVGRGVQTINQYTFANCSGFSGALILGTQVNSIGDKAFQNCSAFSLVISENPNPISATTSSFTGMDFSIPVYVPDGLVSNYQNATGWNNFTNYIEQFTFWDNLDSANWSDEMNWLSMSLPTENDVVCITYNCDLDIDFDVLYVYVYNVNDVLTIKANQTLYTTYGVGLMSPSQLVIEEGGQVIYGNGTNADVTQTVQLSAGWNWFSTYLSGEPTELLQMLENSLGGNGIVIKSNAVSTDYYEDYGWYGDLDDEGLKSSQMYMVKTNAACTVELEGVPANPAEVGITIRHGWNWIGFPCAEAMSVADALAGFQAEDGDILKSSGASTDYYEGFGWYGELETMEPGQGFMYYSNSLTTKTVYFQTGSAKGRRQLLNY